MENQKGGYDELLANIRRLTIMVLDNLEEGSRDRTLDQGEKRLLNSIGVRLLRLWRSVQREGASEKTEQDLARVDGLLSKERGSVEGGV
ncbi:MAG TPA: hypothetical protein VE177_05250 [Candidatus Binatus sp.]|nr:hypothetical protein [Candidatus Binatus sp.]